ncbi:MAG TPA: hypothetical protein VGF14_02120 [Alphaproteobacteria bacterium]
MDKFFDNENEMLNMLVGSAPLLLGAEFAANMPGDAALSFKASGFVPGAGGGTL